MDFNLLHEPWIPVLFHNGRFERLGILQTLEQAHDIRQVAASNPMDRVAIIRFLLALLYWCRGNPPTDATEFPPGTFQKEWFQKLDDNSDCFNLFGEGRRFYQYGFKENSDKFLSANSLIHELPTGTNIWHFHHAADDVHGICPACCALGLLRLPVFATQGGSGKAPGINFKPPVYIVPLGNTLAETLRLSNVHVDHLGSPSWEQEDMQIPSEGNISLLMGLTSLPRRVWLADPVGDENCIGCGSTGPVIKKAVFAGVKKRAVETRWSDPHVVYFLDKNERKSARTDDPMKVGWFRTDRPWSRLLLRILESGKFSRHSYLLTGFATDQTKYIDCWERTIRLDPATTSDTSAAFLERWDKALARLPWDIRDRRRKDTIVERATMSAFRPQVEHAASSHIASFAKGEVDPLELAASEYDGIMQVVSRSLAPGFTTSDYLRRYNINKVRPAVRNEGDEQ